MSAPAFRAVTAADLPLLNRWLERNHVASWWDASEPFGAEDLADPQTAMLVAMLDGRPFAYVQHYRIHGFGPHPFDYLPAGSEGVDLFIGEPDLLGLDHGTALVRLLTERLFAAGVPAIGVDPHPDNARAIRVYEKAGFVVDGAARESPWWRIVPMVRRAAAGG